MLFMGGMALLFLGGTIFQALGIRQPPRWFNELKENQMGVIFGLFMLNSFAASSLSTGAFEVEVDGVTVFSKLEVGRMPNQQDLANVFSQLGFNFHR